MILRVLVVVDCGDGDGGARCCYVVDGVDGVVDPTSDHCDGWSFDDGELLHEFRFLCDVKMPIVLLISTPQKFHKPVEVTVGDFVWREQKLEISHNGH